MAINYGHVAILYDIFRDQSFAFSFSRAIGKTAENDTLISRVKIKCSIHIGLALKKFRCKLQTLHICIIHTYLSIFHLWPIHIDDKLDSRKMPREM